MTGLFGLILTFGLIAAFIFVLFRPHWAVVLVLAMYPIEQLAQASVPFFAGSNRAFINYAIGALAVFAVVSAFTRQRQIFSGYLCAFSMMMFGLYFMTVFSVLYTIAPDVARDRVSEALPYWFLFGAVLPLLVVDLKDLERTMVGYMVLGTVLAVLILINPEAGFYQGRLRLRGTGIGTYDHRSNPLAIGTLGSQIAMIAALLRPRVISTWINVVRVFAFFVGLGLAVSSGSRGQLVAVVLTVILLYPLCRRLENPRQFVLRGVSMTAVAVFGLIAIQFFTTAENEARWRLSGMTGATEARFIFINELLSAWASEPGAYLLGLGTSAFTAVTANLETPYVHNIYAEALGEHGLVGLSLALGMTFATLLAARGIWTMCRDQPVRRSVATAWIGLCLVGLLLSLKQGSYIQIPTPFFLWFMLVKVTRHEQRMELLASVHEHETVTEPDGLPV